SVEDASLAVRPHPRPRLLAPPLLARFEDDAILLVVLRVDVGLVPALEAAETLHERMIGLRDRRAKSAGVVRVELSADEIDIRIRLDEAVRSAVDRDEALAGSDIVEQCLLLLGGDRRGVGVDQQAVEVGERFRIEGVDAVGVRDLDAARREDGLNLAEALG